MLGAIVILRAFYLAASALILVIQAVPALQARFLAYGSRASTAPSPSPRHAQQRSPSALEWLLDCLASIRVPHRYFTHFYVVSVACSLFWGVQMWRTLRVSPVYASWPPYEAGPLTMGQIQLVWLLMLLQGGRRLVESLTYTSTSKSEMWFGHYLLGLVFYLTVNVAIWIEGPCSLDTRGCQGAFFDDKMQPVPATEPGLARHLSALTRRHPWKVGVLLPAILAAHVLQHMYHAYLFRLRTQHSTYQLPAHPLFPSLLCPHYTCEILIYLLMSVLAGPASPSSNWPVNGTLLCATVFVAVNLGVTASGTKAWYMQRFGPDKVGGRTRVIPWVW